MSKLKLIQTYRESDNLVDWLQRLVGTVAEVENWREIGAAGNPAFENSWANATGTASFMKDPFNNVWIKGAVDTGTINTTIFTLPVGYIPDEDAQIITSQGGNAVRLIVRTTGIVETDGATSNTNTSIAISYKL